MDGYKKRFNAAESIVCQRLHEALKADFYDEAKGAYRMASLITFCETVIESHDVDGLAERMAAAALGR